MDGKDTPYSSSGMNGLAWGLFLSVALLFFLGRDSTYAGVVGIVGIALAWLSMCCGIVTAYLVLRSRSNVADLLFATPVILITGFLASAWTLDYARMLLGYGD